MLGTFRTSPTSAPDHDSNLLPTQTQLDHKATLSALRMLTAPDSNPAGLLAAELSPAMSSPIEQPSNAFSTHLPPSPFHPQWKPFSPKHIHHVSGPYARAAFLETHPDQDILPTEHKAGKWSTENVYSLKFDYNFLAIPESNGPVLMHADMTDIPGYWNEMVNSAPDTGTTNTGRGKHDYHQPSEYEKRWFGPFDEWLAKLNRVQSRNSIDRNFHWSDTYTIYHAEEQVSVSELLIEPDISVTGSTSITSSFGYYLEASIIPPEVQECYIFFQAGAQAQASFTIKVLLKLTLIARAPSLHPSAFLLSSQLSLSGQITTSVGYTFPSIDVSFGKQDSNNDEENESGPVDPNTNNQGYDFSVGYNVNLEGSLDTHIIPSLQIGVSVLGGTLIDAQLFMEADIYGGISIAGSVSQSHFGVALNAGLTRSVLFCRANPLSLTFYNNVCHTQQQTRQGPSILLLQSSGHGRPRSYNRHTPYPGLASLRCMRAYLFQISPAGVQIPTSAVVNSANQTSIHHKRARVPFLPDNLFCPAVGSDILDTPLGSKTSPSTIPHPSNPFPGVPTTWEVSTSFDAVFNMPPAAHEVGAHPPSSYQPLSFDDAFGSAPALPAFNISSNQAPSTPSDVSPSPAPPLLVRPHESPAQQQTTPSLTDSGFRHSTSPRPPSPVFNSKASAASPPLPNHKDSTEPPASASRTSKLSLHFPFGKSKKEKKVASVAKKSTSMDENISSP
ncbi:hypothetical protein BS47DRAFT_1392832 [Hydnum rufescens UP504]|uniref:Uncharacterized protein n=1 Tax=Hydnum rufescens UP504 TaxID=1448309 RepID=A0A9P6AXQ2_9AGAM|nr:hypothetical protein BS47DRAFT_1392832 [Hydnum rufescens UP504]